MARYRVIFDKNGCTGAGRCYGIRPELWSKDAAGKAELKNGRKNPVSGKYELEIGENELPAYRESALICPVYVIDIVNVSDGKSILNLKPATQKETAPVIRAKYDSRKEWSMDPEGFFTILPFPEEGLIRVRCYGGDHSLKFTVEGKNAEEIYNTIVREKAVSLFQHAAYLGSELMKAEIAMKKNLKYVQDDPLP